MRLIERQLTTAIERRAPFHKDNTQYNPATREVFLYGNRIATVEYTITTREAFLYGDRTAPVEYTTTEWVAHPDLDTLAAWPTVTTRSRLRALGVEVSVSGGVQAINAVPVDVLSNAAKAHGKFLQWEVGERDNGTLFARRPCPACGLLTGAVFAQTTARPRFRVTLPRRGPAEPRSASTSLDIAIAKAELEGIPTCECAGYTLD